MNNHNITISSPDMPVNNLQQAPLVKMREPIIFPYCLGQLLIEGEENIAAVQFALTKNRQLAIFPMLPGQNELNELPVPMQIETFGYKDVEYAATGVLVRILKNLTFPDGSQQLLVRGLKRITAVSVEQGRSALQMANFHPVPEAAGQDEEILAQKKNALIKFQQLASLMPNLPDELQAAANNTPSPGRLADLFADSLNFSYLEKLILLNLPDLHQRYDFLAVLMNREVEILSLSMKIQNDVHQAMSQNQRDFFLREQLRVIQEELGQDSRTPDIVELEKRISETELPEAVLEVIQKEMKRLEMTPPNAPEYHIAYTYLNWLLDIPWYVLTEDRLDAAEAQKVLDEDHYGLEDVKKRILEFLAVLQLRQNENHRSPILCLIGPPGVGKTSLGKSIARSMNRKFIRVSLGGVRDEAEIRGHRRTYVGALPGRIIQNLKKAGSANPVFMLDEIDKLASDVKGDPASALLEVLDPAQNSEFNDHYIELDCDLSKVFFIATANMEDTIPGPLRDRMEIIRLPGYTSLEKREIAKRYLVPRQITENGLADRKVRFQMSAIDEIIDYYTREAGVRQLERTVAQVLRRIARRIVTGEIPDGATITVNGKLVRELLGARKYLLDEVERNGGGIGSATGMAWTGCGGVILPVEIIAIPGGKGNLKLTGSLGKVMQESAETAFSLVRAHAAVWGIDPAYFNENDFHIHVPDGATPKDGPSAGVTMTMALISLLTKTPLRSRFSMTGEITLRGNVTAVGGIREKVIAALRAGVTTIMMPEENRKDAEELPDEVRSKLELHFVRDFHEAALVAFNGKVKTR